MGILSRFFRRPLKSSQIKTRIREQPGPLTVMEAWAHAKTDALSLGADAKLLLITSGTDIRPDGKSLTWEFLFAIESRQARLLLSYGPSDDAEDIESAPVMVVKHISTSTEKASGQLPFDFRDSSEVVEELSLSGVDFVAGPTDMKLTAKVSAEGLPVWVTHYWGEERAVPFATLVG